MTDMLQMIRTLGDQLRWAESLRIPELPPSSEVLVAGMGGSGIAGDYGSALASGGDGRVSVHKGYSPLPGWARRVRPVFIGISYSGNTEETLDMVGAADTAGLNVVTITTGGRLAEMSDSAGWPSIHVPPGLQPRAAVGYLVGAVSRVLQATGTVDDQSSALVEAADLVDGMTAEGSNAWELADQLSSDLVGRVSIIYGGGPLSGTAAQRWKTQINENAKMPAWWSVLPELDHNELVGWETIPEHTRGTIAIVALTDTADHPRVKVRLEHSSDLTGFAVPWLPVVHSSGESALARLMTLTATGDLVSWMLATKAGADPVPVVTIEKLKKLLVES
ncbi:MAG: bifunctional phosphoglucose/phosphomannose isomerase [Acidimicrobiia bacterium]